MPATKLTPLDTSFLAVESDTAHMHVGWVCQLAPCQDGPTPSFEQLRNHIGARLARAPRYRQRLEPMLLGLGSPTWVDDEDFDLEDHVLEAKGSDLMAIAAKALSKPLEHGRPLWEITLVEGLEGGGLGIVGKAHHCMVDGVAAVELASLLLDAEAEPAEPAPDHWSPDSAPPRTELLGRGVLGGLGGQLRAVAAPVRTLTSLRRLRALPARIEAVGRAAVDTARPAAETESLNEAPLSSERHLGVLKRPLAQLEQIKHSFGVTINDVLLAAVSGALRDYLVGQGEQPHPLKAMIPVDVRVDGESGPAGNRISFMFVDLPCEEPDRILRLRLLAAAVGERKQQGLPSASEAILDAIGQVPNPLRGIVSRFIARPRFFNLTVSNIPGPREPMFMAGCRLEAAYPVVPVSQRHALSIGMTSIGDQACFGLYADRRLIPDVDAIANGIEGELDALLAARVREQPLPREVSS